MARPSDSLSLPMTGPVPGAMPSATPETAPRGPVVEPKFVAQSSDAEGGAKYLKTWLDEEKKRREQEYMETEARALGYESAAARLQEQMALKRQELMSMMPSAAMPRYGLGDLVAGLGGMALGQGGAALDPIQKRAADEAEMVNRQNMLQFQLQQQAANAEIGSMAKDRESFIDEAMNLRGDLMTQRGQDYRADLAAQGRAEATEQRREAAFLKTPAGMYQQMLSMGMSPEEASSLAVAQMDRSRQAARLSGVRADHVPKEFALKRDRFEWQQYYQSEILTDRDLDRTSREKVAQSRINAMFDALGMRLDAQQANIYLKHELDMIENEKKTATGDRSSAGKVIKDAESLLKLLGERKQALQVEAAGLLMGGDVGNPRLMEIQKELETVDAGIEMQEGRKAAAVEQLAAPSRSPAIVQSAQSYLGTKYVWGGESKAGADCSGMVCQALKDSGINIGRHTADGLFNHSRGRRVSIEEIQPGDIIFFHSTQKNLGPGKASHVGIYAGDGMMIDASATQGKTVRRAIPASLQQKILGVKRFD